MKIVMVSEHASPLATLGGVDAGGQNVHVAALSAALARRGHAVTVYTRRDDPDLPVRVQLLPAVDVVHVPVGPAEPIPKDELHGLMPAFGRWMRRDLQDTGRPAVLHSHFWMSGLAVEAAGLDVPWLHTYHALGTVKRRHQGSKDTSPRGRVEAETRVGLAADRVVATCRDEVVELAAMGIPRARVEVVPCGVDVHHFTPEGESEPRPDGAHRLLYLGRLVERKGVDTVVRALPRLPGVELVVAGGGGDIATDPVAHDLLRLAEELGVADRVDLRGPVPRAEVPALLRSADVVVGVPWYEPFGIVPLEAAACGRPLVGSAVGGLLDSVEHARTGYLVPPRDPDAVADAVAELLADPDRRREMGRAARSRAEERFSWEQVAARTEEVYRCCVRRDELRRTGVSA